MSAGRIVLSVLGLAAGAGVVVVLGALGVPIEFASAWLLLIVAVGVLSSVAFFGDRSWPPQSPSPRPRGSEVSRLSWNINARTGEAGLFIVRRVERVLRHRLARLGLDVDDPSQAPAVDAVLGEGIRETFAHAEVTRADLERVMTAIDRLPSPTNQER